MEPDTLLIIGSGRLGGALLDTLALRYPQHRFVISSRSLERAALRANLTRYVCAQWGAYPEITPVAIELANHDTLAEVLTAFKPGVTFNATTPFPWWKIDSLPPELAKAAHTAGPGTWAALDVQLPRHIVTSRKLAGDRSVFVNGCYPDMVNAFLAGSAESPVVGIGNIANIVPGLRLAFAAELGAAPTDVQVQLVGHHFTSLNAPTHRRSLGAPYRLSITLSNAQVPLHFDEASDEPFQLLARHARRTRGVEGQGVTVSSAAIVTAALLNREIGRFHSPGALGLPGGYPVDIGADRSITLDLPPRIDEADAISAMQNAQRFDGIDSVTAGNVTPTAGARQALLEITGVDLESVSDRDVDLIANELLEQLDARHSLGLVSA